MLRGTWKILSAGNHGAVEFSYFMYDYYQQVFGSLAMEKKNLSLH